LPAKKAVALGIIINELITNAAKHAFSQERECAVEVLLEHAPKEGLATLTIANSGAPLPEDFDPEEANSLGVQLVMGLTEQLSGSLKIRREPRTAFLVSFPC
jgi:two-component sensor histidine kinase